MQRTNLKAISLVPNISNTILSRYIFFVPFLHSHYLLKMFKSLFLFSWQDEHSESDTLRIIFFNFINDIMKIFLPGFEMRGTLVVI